MPRILASGLLLGSAIVLLFATGCGQGEGGRCQIDSDCASGLTCHNPETGNGTCGPNNAGESPAADAAAKQDISPLPGPEVEPEADAQSVADVDVSPELDTGTLADGGAASPNDASGSIDGQAIDSL